MQALTFQEHRQHLIDNCGYRPHSDGRKFHKEYADHVRYATIPRRGDRVLVKFENHIIGYGILEPAPWYGHHGVRFGSTWEFNQVTEALKASYITATVDTWTYTSKIIFPPVFTIEKA